MGSPAPLAALHFPLVFSLQVAVCQHVSGGTRCRPRHGGRRDVGTAVVGAGWAKEPTPSLPVPPRQGQAASAVVFAPWGAAGPIRRPGLPKVLLHPCETWDGMGWAGMSWDGMGWDGMSWDGMGWNGVGWWLQCGTFPPLHLTGPPAQRRDSSPMPWQVPAEVGTSPNPPS